MFFVIIRLHLALMSEEKKYLRGVDVTGQFTKSKYAE